MIPIENRGASPLHIAGFVILPGETRILSEDLVPAHLRPKVQEEPVIVTDALLDFVARSVGEIVKAMPDLPEEFLTRLQSVEAGSLKPRKGVLDAIVKEKLRRADVREKLHEFDLAVAKMDDAALRAYRENVAAHPELVAAVDAELGRRAGAHETG